MRIVFNREDSRITNDFIRPTVYVQRLISAFNSIQSHLTIRVISIFIFCAKRAYGWMARKTTKKSLCSDAQYSPYYIILYKASLDRFLRKSHPRVHAYFHRARLGARQQVEREFSGISAPFAHCPRIKCEQVIIFRADTLEHILIMSDVTRVPAYIQEERLHYYAARPPSIQVTTDYGGTTTNDARFR